MNSVSLQLIDCTNGNGKGDGPRLFSNGETTVSNSIMARSTNLDQKKVAPVIKAKRIQFQQKQNFGRSEVIKSEHLFGVPRIINNNLKEAEGLVEEEQEGGDSSLCRGGSDLDVAGSENHKNSLIIKNEPSCPRDKELIIDSRRNSEAGKLIGKMTTMSQAESYYPEHRPKISKLSIFGDPWDTTKGRN